MEFVQHTWEYNTMHSERCALALINQSYADDILQTCTLEVCEWFDHPIHQTREEVTKQIDERMSEYDERKALNLAICNEDSVFIWNTEVRHIQTWELSMGIWLWTAYQGKGYGTEVIECLLKRINEHLAYRYIRRDCYKDNLGSVAIAARIWAVLETVKKTKHRKYGEIDDCLYRIYPS